MFGDIGWAELMLIGIVALIVIGPEDLPHMFRQLGRFTAKMRSMSRDFSRAMEQAAKESGVKDVTDGIKGATSATSMGLNTVKAAADRFEKWDPIKAATAAKTAATVAPTGAPAPLADTVVPPNAASQSIHSSETQTALTQQMAAKAIVAKTAGDKVAARRVTDTTQKLASRPKIKPSIQTESIVPATIKTRAPRKPKKVD